MQAIIIFRAVAVGVALSAAPIARTADAQPLGAANQNSIGIIEGLDKHVTRWTMPSALREVSGLAVNENGELLAHDDELGIVFVLDPATGRVKRSFMLGSTPLSDDFEGIAVAGPRIFLITSKGRLYETREPKKGNMAVYSVIDTDLGHLCELEGLAYDPLSRELLVGCKVPRVRYFRSHVAILRWSLDRKSVSVPICIPLKDIPGGRFSTSSLELDQMTSHIVLVSGIEKTLLEITREGHVVATQRLLKDAHRQPEGLTFLGQSLMLIADEGGNGYAGISVYRRKH